MIPICLILFILFIAVITFAIKRADSAQAKVTEEFWEKAVSYTHLTLPTN